MQQDVLLFPEDGHEGLARAGREGDQSRTGVRARHKSWRGAIQNRIVERRDTVGQIGAEPHHETDRQARGCDIAQEARRPLAGVAGHADEPGRLEHLADAGKFRRPPEHWHGGDGETGAPSGQQGEGRFDEVRELNRDAVAGSETEMGEIGGQRLDGCIRLAEGQAAGAGWRKLLPVRRIQERERVRRLLRAAAQQTGRRKTAVPLRAFGLRRGKRVHRFRVVIRSASTVLG